MKNPIRPLIALLALSLAGSPALAEDLPSAPGSKAASLVTEGIEGTTWAGTDSDGDWYEYTFLKGGRLRYSTNTERSKTETIEDPKNVWAQNGQLVVILIQNFSVNLGTIEGRQMKGNAWNVKERRWTWEAVKK